MKPLWWEGALSTHTTDGTKLTAWTKQIKHLFGSNETPYEFRPNGDP